MLFRSGSITEFGHNYLPEFTRITTGQFNITYLAENLSRMLRLPIYDKSKHMLNFFYADGVAFYLVNPIFLLFAFLLIYQIFKKEKKHDKGKNGVVYDCRQLSFSLNLVMGVSFGIF